MFHPSTIEADTLCWGGNGHGVFGDSAIDGENCRACCSAIRSATSLSR